jgi:hypothetical protein
MTKLAVLAVGAVMFVLLAALLWYLAGRFERAGEKVTDPGFRWEVGEQSADGRCVVVLERLETRPQGVAHVLESREVGSVESGDPEYDARVGDLLALARDRARLLNDQARRR